MRRYVIPALLILAAAGAALAGVNWEAYRSLSSAPTQQITDGAPAATATTADTAITALRQRTAGNPVVCVEVDFSGSTGDTCVVTFIPWFIDGDGTAGRIPGLQTITATAGTYTDTAGDNIAPALFFEVPSGASHYEIRHAAPSGGTADLTWVAYGADPQ